MIPNAFSAVSASLTDDLPTPTISASDSYYRNETSYTVIATILTPGTVSSWTVKDSSGNEQMITGNLLPGQAFYVEPGDSIKFSYSSAPTWKWRALR